MIDNTDADFSVTGTWPASTTVTGYQGTNYQTHEVNDSPPGAIVVDNADAGFSVTGTWPTSTAVGGYLGSNYQVHSANGEEPSAIVVDNLAGSFTGTWSISTSVGGYFGTNYQAQAAGSGANSFTWTPSIPTTGSYRVYVRWTQHPNRSTQATYTVNHAGGATAVTVNQEANGGTWQLLGTFTLNAGTGNTVVLVDQGDGYVIADAVKVVPDGALPNTATWTPTIPTAGSYKVYARWTAHPNRATDAKYTVTHAGGDTLVTIDQEQNNGSWVLLGTFSMTPGAGHKVSLTDQANGYVIADAIRLLDATAPEFNTATWTPNAPAGQYEVYAKWTANPNRATNATYTVNHAQGTTQVPVNQQLNGGAFNLLGTFNLNGNSTVTLSDQANGYVIADAIQLIALTTVPKMYFVHTDHLNTPRLIASDTGQTVWTWNNDDPYGNNAPNENPAGAGQFTCNLRLPGQYFDSETNTHYNYFRDHDPLTGRYVQSDPIGFEGGIDTYAYAGNSPTTWIDTFGLRVDWGNFVLNNPLVQSNLVALNDAIVRTGFADECFVIRVTGGDRYRDPRNPRTIRSATNNSVVSGASQTSPHLIERGARAADFSIDNSSAPNCACKPVTNKIVDEALKKTDFSPGNTSRDYPEAPHTHVALPPTPKFNYRP